MKAAARPGGDAMNVLVTGAAGFIGSHLCRRLLSEGCSGGRRIDCFTDYYPRWMKERNVAPLLQGRGASSSSKPT